MQIKNILLILIGSGLGYIKLDSSQHCDCFELNQFDCEAQDYWCAWNKTSQKCSNRQLNQGCRYYKWQESCNSNPERCLFLPNYKQCVRKNCTTQNNQQTCVDLGCMWNNTNEIGICQQDQKKCIDEQLDCKVTTFYCAEQLQKCVQNYSVTTTSNSANTISCDQYISYKQCRTSDLNCSWDYQSFKCKSSIEEPNECSSKKNIIDCVIQQCLWNQKEKYCYKGCEQIKKADICNTKIIIEQNQRIRCQYINGKCQNATDFSFFSEVTCNIQTFHNYKYQNGICQACTLLLSNDLAPLIDVKKEEEVDVSNLYSQKPNYYIQILIFIYILIGLL